MAMSILFDFFCGDLTILLLQKLIYQLVLMVQNKLMNSTEEKSREMIIMKMLSYID
ncbi:MAG: hypothetical protein PHY47_13705 [Lachnospiraceae bacterium]|nr:hypothetical protein [Lachnospiraceae bacterium]